MALRKCLLLAASMLCANPLAAQPAAEPPPAAPASQRDLRPNVLIWMLDDVGFAQLSSYGGLIETPNIDRVAQMGLRYSNYHTAPVCSAARASFLSGRMPHSICAVSRREPAIRRVPHEERSIAYVSNDPID